MGIKTYLKSADLAKVESRISGTIMTAPAMVYSDANGNVTYACDVDIGQEGVIDDNGTVGVLPLYNVPLAANNNSLRYARPGNAVELQLINAGTWEITGFSKTKAGTFTVRYITLPNICSDFPQIGYGEETQMGVTQNFLTLGELGTFKPFGELPLGSQALYLNGNLYGFTT